MCFVVGDTLVAAVTVAVAVHRIYVIAVAVSICGLVAPVVSVVASIVDFTLLDVAVC